MKQDSRLTQCTQSIIFSLFPLSTSEGAAAESAGDRKFGCAHCAAVFKNACHLYRHERTAHNVRTRTRRSNIVYIQNTDLYVKNDDVVSQQQQVSPATVHVAARIRFSWKYLAPYSRIVSVGVACWLNKMIPILDGLERIVFAQCLKSVPDPESSERTHTPHWQTLTLSNPPLCVVALRFLALTT